MTDYIELQVPDYKVEQLSIKILNEINNKFMEGLNLGYFYRVDKHYDPATRMTVFRFYPGPNYSADFIPRLHD